VNTCEYDGAPFTEPRSHPWADSAEARYYDLTGEPALIRSSLEDFLPWTRYAAIEDFYALLERINHAKSPFESNDCAFSGPQPTEGQEPGKAFECSGRVMLLYRALELNREKERLHWLKTALHQQLHHLDRAFRGGTIGTTLVPVRYLALAPEGEPQLGQELMVSFWAWGSSADACMRNLTRLFKNLSLALRQVSARTLT
jgi:hypothetical protein